MIKLKRNRTYSVTLGINTEAAYRVRRLLRVSSSNEPMDLSNPLDEFPSVCHTSCTLIQHLAICVLRSGPHICGCMLLYFAVVAALANYFYITFSMAIAAALCSVHTSMLTNADQTPSLRHYMRVALNTPLRCAIVGYILVIPPIAQITLSYSVNREAQIFAARRLIETFRDSDSAQNKLADHFKWLLAEAHRTNHFDWINSCSCLYRNVEVGIMDGAVKCWPAEAFAPALSYLSLSFVTG